MKIRFIGLLALASLAMCNPVVGQGTRTFGVKSTGKKYAIDRYPSAEGGAKRPVVVLLHGVDGMVSDSGPQITDFAKELAGEGYLVFVPYYFDDDRKYTQAQLGDVLKGRLARTSEYLPIITAGINAASGDPDADAKRFGLVGFSLGGGLALSFAESVSTGQVKALVDLFGYLYDAAILTNAGKLPPTLVYHNKNDLIVKVKNSEDLIAAMGTKVENKSQFFDEMNLEHFNHPFLPGGSADKASRSGTMAWLRAHF